MAVPGWHAGIDIGGTFTDIFALSADGAEARSAKVLTRAGDPLCGLREALAAVRLAWDDLAALVHGTTLVTNAIVENRLAPVALVATEGFGDVLAIGRQNRLHLYRLAPPPKAPCLVPGRLRFEVRERLAPDGEVLAALDPLSCAALAQRIAASDVQAVAVSLLHAYSNPAHELALEPLLRKIVPHVSLSHRVNPEEREFERTNATVLNAAAMPLIAAYLERLQGALRPCTPLHLFHSLGGMVSADTARETPLLLALSGPAAGVAATCQIAKKLGLEQAIAFDMGGTTTDVCLVRHGLPELGFGKSIAGHVFRQPMIGVESIGAGGGSIAQLERGMLKVGPQSAGAAPGPACYGLGGVEPTLTDADVVLGYLDAAQPLAGRVRLDRERAELAVGKLAREMGAGAVAAALGILRVVHTNMARALRNVTVEKGVDGRKCVLVAYGGAGPMHAAMLAQQVGIARVVVPAASSVFSALGCASSGPSYTRQQTLRMPAARWDGARLERVRAALLAQVLGALRLAPEDDYRAEDVALVRYAGQSYAIEVPYAPPAGAEALGRDFRARHESLYGFSEDEPWDIEALRLRVSLPGRAAPNETQPRHGAPGAQESMRECWFAGEAPVRTPCLARGGLRAGERRFGPLIAADAWSTVVVPPGAALTPDAAGNLLIEVGALA